MYAPLRFSRRAFSCPVVHPPEVALRRWGSHCGLRSWTAMMLAATAGHAEIVRMLIGAGADIHAVGREGYVPALYIFG